MRFTNLTRAVEIGANSYLLEAAGKRIVLDSGLHPRNEGLGALPLFEKLAEDSVDAIFLSHSHQDHVGSLPVLMRKQPRAAVFMSQVTRMLSDVMLHNSVNVMMRQREDLELNDYPLFTHREVEQATKRWQGCPLHQRCSIHGERLPENDDSEVSFEFFDAGHILGAVGTLIRAEGQKIFYTGDVNFEDQTISRGAAFPEEGLDVLIMESTRGEQPSPEGYTRASEEARLAKAIKETFEKGGSVMIPVFALGKTQELLAILHGFQRKGLLAKVPIYIGGLSTKLTEIYDRFAHSTPRLLPELQILDEIAPFVLAGRNNGKFPIRSARIYALSSGMMTEKTLSNHFAQRVLAEKNHSIFFIGYADPESPAGRLRAAKPGSFVQLDEGVRQQLNCDVQEFNFSGHSSRESLRAWARKVAPKKLILVHGDAPAIEWFRSTLSADLPNTEVIVPEPGKPIDL